MRRGPKAAAGTVPDFRSAGTMTQFLREFFASADRGYTRQEIKEVLRAQPRFKPMIERPRSGHAGAIKSLLRRREIVDLGGLLYPRTGHSPDQGRRA